MRRRAFLAGVALAAAACGGEPEPDNTAPVVTATIGPLALEATDTSTVDLSSHFSDADGDELVYRAISYDRSVATVSVRDGVLGVAGLKRGATAALVNAQDPDGLRASQSFDVTVNGKPGPLWVELSYEEADIGAVLVRLQGPGVDSLTPHAGLESYHASDGEAARAFVFGEIAHGDTLLRFWAGDVTAPEDYLGSLVEAAGGDYRQRSTESGSLAVVR